MLRNYRVPIYCTLCFILGCTLTISVVKYEECPDNAGDMSQRKLPQENNEHFIAEVNDKSGVYRFKKTISAFLIVVIMSSPDNVHQRNAIRETWSTYGGSDEVQYFFFVGSKNLRDEQNFVLVKEYENNKDLVLLSETDTYERLTTKILLSFMWLSKIAEFSFMLKCDDDSYVRIPFLVKELKDMVRVNPRKGLYWGFFDGRAHVRRGGKWADRKWVICDRYLPYALGGGYVLSRELVNILADRASSLELYSNEDVAVGAWLSTIRDLERRHDPRFDTEYRSRGCREDYVITHKVSPDMMRKIFSSLNKSGKFCLSGEFRTRNSYIYNWNVPPSRCCDRKNSSIP
ncbi:beta-1,3-galactosyltransferase 6-like [Hetaerina americana]|uniref:beta-1,3-galactosyltransferase 6-like n=1 Tax=Hetaerina americana TaxID=62018 RepID=UPI003A7F3C00